MWSGNDRQSSWRWNNLWNFAKIKHLIYFRLSLCWAIEVSSFEPKCQQRMTSECYLLFAWSYRKKRLDFFHGFCAKHPTFIISYSFNSRDLVSFDSWSFPECKKKHWSNCFEEAQHCAFRRPHTVQIRKFPHTSVLGCIYIIFLLYKYWRMYLCLCSCNCVCNTHHSTSKLYIQQLWSCARLSNACLRNFIENSAMIWMRVREGEEDEIAPLPYIFIISVF